jgi:Domain of unknown function (DUF2357)
MVSSPISNAPAKLRFLNVNGDPIPMPREWQLAQVEVLWPHEQWQAVKLYCQGQLLEVYPRQISGQVRIVARWERANVGHYALQLQIGEEIEELSFAVWPQKISQAAFATLLEQLELQLPAAVAIALQRLGAFAGVTFRPPEMSTLSGEWERLRCAVWDRPGQLGLLSLLTQIAADPHTQLQTQTHWVTRDRVRRPAIAALAQAFYQPHNLDDQGHPQRYPDSRIETTVDGYENRLLKLFLQ